MLHIMASSNFDVSKQPRETAQAASILHSLTTFVHAVDEMDDTILVPSRLRDMETGEKKDNNAIIPLREDASVQPLAPDADLYAFYKVLNAIKCELVQGPDSARDEESEAETSDDKSNEQAQQVAKSFRHHLAGLFGVLNQLTGTAKFLTSRYQEEIGDLSTSSSTASISSFTL